MRTCFLEKHPKVSRNLCQDSKVNALKEITRSQSQNQLDYILIQNKYIKERFYVTSFNNFISDHKSITVRIGLGENFFSKEFKIKLNFNNECHLKTTCNETAGSPTTSSSSDENSFHTREKEDRSFEEESSFDEDQNKEITDDPSLNTFKRRFHNIDLSTCWLNSCLQMILTAIDHSEYPPGYTSESFQPLVRILAPRNIS